MPHPSTSRPLPRRPLRPALVGIALGSLALACGLEPKAAELRYSLNEKTIAELENAQLEDVAPATAAAQIQGALEMLFGTPSDPQFLVLREWYDNDQNPNPAKWRLDEETFAAVEEGNRRRFALQLELIEAGRYAEVPQPRYADDLWADWTERVLPQVLSDDAAMVDPSDEELGTWKDEAAYVFESHYPTLRESSRMYRQQCLHCHGTEGGGDGPTSPYLSPRPRDYRDGKFKWVAVERNTAPRREDLLHILMEGVNTTAMPPFARFSRGELEGLVDYVRLLAMRGQVENLLTAAVKSEGYLSAATVLENYQFVWERWDKAPERYVYFEDDVPREAAPEMIEHGRQLFLNTKVGQCVTCHGPEGRGNGESIWELDPFRDGKMRRRLDEWGTARQDAGLPEAALKGFETSPRNFQQAVFRGGGRPIDLYRRIKYGISGTIMPAAPAEFSDEDIWSLVYFVLHLVEQSDVARLIDAKVALEEGRSAHEPAAQPSGH